jgi:hypothetical protein
MSSERSNSDRTENLVKGGIMSAGADLVTIHIIFSGLVTLVPSGTEKAPGPIRILLPDSSAHQVSADGCRLPQHFPLLAIYAAPPSSGQGTTCRQVSGTYPKVKVRSCAWRAPEFLKPTNKEDKPEWGWLLKGVVLELAGTNLQGGGIELTHVARELKMFPSDRAGTEEDKERTDYRWVGKPPSVYYADPECIAGVDCPLAARVIVKQGDVTACHFAGLVKKRGRRARQGSPLNYSDSDELVLPAMRWGAVDRSDLSVAVTSPSPQARADGFQVTFTVRKGTLLVLRLHKLADLSGTGRKIRLHPMNDLKIWIENAADPRAGHLEKACFRLGIDRHFEVLYDTAVDSHHRRCPLGKVKVPRMSRFSKPVSDYDGNTVKLNSCNVLEFGFPLNHGGVPPHDKTVCAIGRTEAIASQR